MAEHQNFDLAALYDALDVERCSRQMSCAAVAAEINGPFRDVPKHRPIARSTITGLQRKSIGEGDGILQMLLWLRRTPESFVYDMGEADAECFGLRDPGKERILRWDTKALYVALNAARQARRITWQQVADEVGGFTPTMLTHLRKGGRTSFPGVMRITRWLGQPATVFTRASSW